MGKVLELFCGRNIIAKEFQKQGFNTWTIDNDPQFNADEKADILELNPKTMTRFDVIWASPPCTQFTVARIGKNWIKTERGL